MNTEEITVNNEKQVIITDYDDEYENDYILNNDMEDTIDLSKTVSNIEDTMEIKVEDNYE